jgi:SulP family sulfate permease
MTEFSLPTAAAEPYLHVARGSLARDGLRAIVLDASAISDSDADGAHTLAELHQRLADRNVMLHLATVRGPVRDLLTRTGAWQPLRESGQVHPDIPEAITAASSTGPHLPRPEVPAQEVL